MRLPVEEHALWARQTNGTTQPAAGSMPSSTRGAVISGAVVGALFVGSILGYFILRCIRVRHADPKYIPGQFLKDRWRAWSPRRFSFKYHSPLQRNGSSQEMQSTNSPTSGRAAGGRRARQPNGQGVDRDTAVDRHTSVRSVITLPAYSADVGENEQILGREGDREGIDTVVEFPENEMEEEERREEEMQSLYQIRQVRRDERAQRSDRRRRRQEAIARNDHAALEDLRRERRERNAADVQTSQNLISEHENRDRRGRIAEVEYADVGLARPDGSRIRANSNESVRPLLGSAASPGHNRRPSHGPYAQHGASLSTSSLRFAMTPDISDDEGDGSLATRTRSRGDSTGDYSIRSRPWPLGNDFSASRVTLATMRTQDTLDTVESEASEASAANTDRPSTRANTSGELPPPDYEDINLDGSPAISRITTTTLPSIRTTSIPNEDAPPYSSPTHPLPGSGSQPQTARSSTSGDTMHTPRSTFEFPAMDGTSNSGNPTTLEVDVPSIEITPHTPVQGGSRPSSSGQQ